MIPCRCLSTIIPIESFDTRLFDTELGRFVFRETVSKLPSPGGHAQQQNLPESSLLSVMNVITDDVLAMDDVDS